MKTSAKKPKLAKLLRELKPTLKSYNKKSSYANVLHVEGKRWCNRKFWDHWFLGCLKCSTCSVLSVLLQCNI